MGDGKVPVALLGELLRACGQNPTEGEWRKLVGDNSGKLLADILVGGCHFYTAVMMDALSGAYVLRCRDISIYILSHKAYSYMRHDANIYEISIGAAEYGCG